MAGREGGKGNWGVMSPKEVFVNQKLDMLLWLLNVVDFCDESHLQHPLQCQNKISYCCSLPSSQKQALVIKGTCVESSRD